MITHQSAPLSCWPLEVYDYEKEAVTDEAVGGIDLHAGAWIHCKWCNTTLPTTSHSLSRWKTHKKTKTHVKCKQKSVEGELFVQPQIISCSSQSSVSSSVDPPQLLSGSQLPLLDQDSLLFVRRHLYKNKQHQSRHERDVSNVINAMTSLVTDQQSDLTTLQDKMLDMTQQIQQLKKELEMLRRKRSQQQNNVQARPPEIDASTPYAAFHRTQFASLGRPENTHKQGSRTKQTRPSSSSKRSKRMTMGSMSDMDEFEKRFQLKERW
uniref:BED-type domain-containing protein n=1 Tax=Peronospora matthiolae TaxID=2874970 RepID=A0AAV1TVV4_9STRA